MGSNAIMRKRPRSGRVISPLSRPLWRIAMGAALCCIHVTSSASYKEEKPVGFNSFKVGHPVFILKSEEGYELKWGTGVVVEWDDSKNWTSPHDTTKVLDAAEYDTPSTCKYVPVLLDDKDAGDLYMAPLLSEVRLMDWARQGMTGGKLSYKLHVAPSDETFYTKVLCGSLAPFIIPPPFRLKLEAFHKKSRDNGQAKSSSVIPAWELNHTYISLSTEDKNHPEIHKELRDSANKVLDVAKLNKDFFDMENAIINHNKYVWETDAYVTKDGKTIIPGGEYHKDNTHDVSILVYTDMDNHEVGTVCWFDARGEPIQLDAGKGSAVIMDNSMIHARPEITVLDPTKPTIRGIYRILVNYKDARFRPAPLIHEDDEDFREQQADAQGFKNVITTQLYKHVESAEWNDPLSGDIGDRWEPVKHDSKSMSPKSEQISQTTVAAAVAAERRTFDPLHSQVPVPVPAFANRRRLFRNRSKHGRLARRLGKTVTNPNKALMWDECQY